MYQNVPVTANAIIVRNKKVLLGKRAKNPHKGTWCTIGGFVEPGESLEEGLAREITEEINCLLVQSAYFGSSPLIYNSKVILSVFFICKVKGTPERNEEHTELIWTPTMIQPVGFPVVKAFLQKFFQAAIC